MARTPFVHLFIIFIFILDQESSGHVTHDSHKLQTKAINHSTRHYMNRRELESDQPIHVPLLGVLSFPPSAGQPQCIVHCRHSQTARATPSNHTQGYGSCNCSALHINYAHALLELLIYETTCNRQNRVRIEAVQAATQRRLPV